MSGNVISADQELEQNRQLLVSAGDALERVGSQPAEESSDGDVDSIAKRVHAIHTSVHEMQAVLSPFLAYVDLGGMRKKADGKSFRLYDTPNFQGRPPDLQRSLRHRQRSGEVPHLELKEVQQLSPNGRSYLYLLPKK